MPGKIIEINSQAGFCLSSAAAKELEGNCEEALLLVLRAVRMCPDEAEYLIKAAELYSELGLYVPACRMAVKALLNGAQADRALMVFGETLLWRGETDRCKAVFAAAGCEKAAKLLDKILFAEEITTPGSRTARRVIHWGVKGCRYLDAEDYVRAEYCFRHYTHLRPGLRTGYIMLALALARQNRREEAIEQAERAMICDDAADSRINLMYARVLMCTGRTEEAKQLLRGIAPDTNDTTECINYIYALAAAGMDEEIGSCAVSALRSNPGYAFFLNAQSVSAVKRGCDAETALSGWRRILALDPGNEFIAACIEKYLSGAGFDEEPDYTYRITQDMRNVLDCELMASCGAQLTDRASDMLVTDEAGGKLALNVLFASGDDTALRLICLASVLPVIPASVRSEAADIMRAAGLKLPAEFRRLEAACAPGGDELVKAMTARSAKIVEDAAFYGADRDTAARLWQSFIDSGIAESAINADAACAALICAEQSCNHGVPDYRAVMREYRLRPRQLKRVLRQLYSVNSIAEDFDDAF